MDHTLIKTIFHFVKIIDKKDLKGEDKKNELYENLIKVLGVDNVKEKVEIINFVLETIIYLSNTHMISGINADKFKSCCLK